MPNVVELQKRLSVHAASHWPQIVELTVRQRAGYVYIGALIKGELEPTKLCRLRATEDPELWESAMYRYSNERYDDQAWGLGSSSCTPEEALDEACGLYVEPAAEMQQVQQHLMSLLAGGQLSPPMNRAERRAESRRKKR